jgi:quercetin dioxygenase-like cupin family protein
VHVAPAAFRSVRRDGVALHFAVLETMAWVVAEFPQSGSRGTFAEAWCERPHWGVSVGGDLELDLDGEREPVPPGTAFHVPAGVRHRILAAPGARVGGFEPIAAGAAVDDEALRTAGFEVLGTAIPPGPAGVTMVHPRPTRPPGASEILAESRRMGHLLLTRTRFGRRAGYTSEPCDQPHWGLVTMGNIAIEWEDDVEVVGTGDVFHCPAGPPGHRLQAAEAATVLDVTPIDGIRSDQRVVSWRARAAQAALDEDPGTNLLGLAALG